MPNIENQIDPTTAAAMRGFFAGESSAPAHSETGARRDKAAERAAYDTQSAPEQQVEATAPKPAPTPEQTVRNEIAAKHGLSEGIRDLYLSHVTDPDQLDQIAAALKQRGITTDHPAVRRTDNVAPREGSTRSTGGPDRNLRDFSLRLFGRDPDLTYTRHN
ncbi:hypothetical protein [Frigoribacterium sp. Leaf172]|uniref:hypothetical protein n=1 Tax=Frigoribacterium sp. Leaf172 TaxID=1736285 RepID=UPI0006F40AE8|nr:hypothetical protein [Frigoribacterium sp. Leaf172]KQR64576.1 hypothetical protein ASF89_08815 [Frigoribacterium sp. Leaf172]